MFSLLRCYLNYSKYSSHKVIFSSSGSCYEFSWCNGLLACFFFHPLHDFSLCFLKCLVLKGYLVAWFIILHAHPSEFGVGQVVPLWWINWIVHLWLLLVLLLCKIRYVRLHANLLFLWLHGLCLLWFLPHAWQYWVPCLLVFCPAHLPFNQVRIASHIIFSMFNGYAHAPVDSVN